MQRQSKQTNLKYTFYIIIIEKFYTCTCCITIGADIKWVWSVPHVLGEVPVPVLVKVVFIKPLLLYVDTSLGRLIPLLSLGKLLRGQS